MLAVYYHQQQRRCVSHSLQVLLFSYRVQATAWMPPNPQKPFLKQQAHSALVLYHLAHVVFPGVLPSDSCSVPRCVLGQLRLTETICNVLGFILLCFTSTAPKTHMPLIVFSP